MPDASDTAPAGALAGSLLLESMEEGVAYHQVVPGPGGEVDGLFLYVNPAFERLTGLQGVVGRRLSEVVPGLRETTPEIFRSMARVARTGVPERQEVELPQLGAWFSVRAFRPQEGHLVAVLADVTGCHQAVSQLEAERERLATTLGAMGDAVLAANREGRVTLLNEAAAELTGWSAPEALGRPAAEVLRLVDEESGAALESPVERVLRAGGASGPGERCLLLGRDGRSRPVAESTTAIRSAAGALDGAVVVFRDQSPERRAEELVRARLDLLEYAPTHTLQEVLRHTLDEVGRLTGSAIGFYHFVEADQRTLSLQTWSTRTMEEFCKAKGAGLHYPIDMAGVWVDCVRVRRPVVHNDYAALLHRKGLPPGHAPVVRELVVPILRDERIVAILGVGNKETDYVDEDVEAVSYLADACWDVTARKRAEESRDQLEIQLRQSQKLESIGRLAGGIAHDFNNLLTVILSCTRLVEEALPAGPPEALAEDVQEIRRAAERARDLTRRLLSFARKQAASPIALDVGIAVRSIEGLLRRVLGDDVRLEVDLQTGLWRILFDPGLFEQVLLNLAVNARDAMPGGGALRIEARNASVEADQPGRREEDQPGDWVRLSVRDSGVGMAPEVLSHLFEPFFTTKELGKGTGLGLAMVHGLVSQAGGHVYVASLPGQGTTFELCFPRTSPPAVELPVEPVPAPPASRGRGEAVLVVEDEAQVRSVIVRTLRDAGYAVVEADGREAALGLLRGWPGPLQLLVSDLQMPGGDGRALAREVRRLRPDAGVLLVSGSLGGVDEADLTRDADDFLAKPFDPAALLARVRAVLDRRGRALAAPAGAAS